MKTSVTSLLLVLASTSALSALACDVPVAPPTPDGSSATLEEMIAAQGGLLGKVTTVGAVDEALMGIAAID